DAHQAAGAETDPFFGGLALALLAWAQAQTGDGAAAARVLAEAEQAAAAVTDDATQRTALVVLVDWVGARMGDGERAGRVLSGVANAVSAATDDGPFLCALGLAALAWAAAWTGDPALLASSLDGAAPGWLLVVEPIVATPFAWLIGSDHRGPAVGELLSRAHEAANASTDPYECALALAAVAWVSGLTGDRGRSIGLLIHGRQVAL